jgi:aldose 1-epimerase
LRARRYTPVDAGVIPTGEIAPVTGTPLDFTTSHRIGARIGREHPQLEYGLGYDHNFVLDAYTGDGASAPALAATVREPASGRVLEVLTTEPGVQFYTGNFLNGSQIGKGGRPSRHSIFPTRQTDLSFPALFSAPARRSAARPSSGFAPRESIGLPRTSFHHPT